MTSTTGRLRAVDLEELLAVPFAHRGLHRDGVPENSLAAFAHAMDQAVGVELDVRLSADGVPVVHHDPTVRRMCGVPSRVADLPVASLTSLRLAGTAQVVPTLRLALRLIDGAVPVLVDLKAGPSISERRRLLDAVAILVRVYPGPVGIVGFDPLLLCGVAARAPRVARGQSAGVDPAVASRWWIRAACHPFDALWSMHVSKPHFVTFNVDRLPSPAVERARETRPVVAWTVRTGEQYRLARSCSDAVIVEDEAVDVALRDVG